MSLDLSFLNDSIAHQMIAGQYAQGDLESFPADTLKKQEALKYWRMPIESSEESVSQESSLMKTHAEEIEIIRHHIWNVHMERVLKSQKTFLATRFEMILDSLKSISKVTSRTILGIACVVAGLSSVFFCSYVILTPYLV